MAWKTGKKRLKQKRVSFTCGELTLEGLYCVPGGDGAFPAVVLCHPHPIYGGSMDNNVILGVSRALVEKSVIAFMFNFRGVGRSQGRFGGGIAEKEDLAAAIDWVARQPEADRNRLGVAGYSFGAVVALPTVCASDSVRVLALISMPSGPEQISQLKSCTRPKLLISGTNDTVVPVHAAELMGREAAEPKQFELISGADHIWWGYESILSDKLARFFEDIFKST